MNTIPLIFNERQINKSVITSNDSLKASAKMDIGVVLLNSNAIHLRAGLFESLLRCGFSSIVSIEPLSKNFNVEETARRFPQIKFVMPLEELTTGDMINIGIEETSASYVLVLKDTLQISSPLLQSHLAEKFIQSGVYCITPRLLKNKDESIPIQFFPSASGGHFKVRSSNAVSDFMNTLYPFDYIALYNREKFIKLGGFDYTISSAYYQNLDLSLRAWLWGEKIQISTSFLLSYSDEVPIEDITVDLSYLHFYLKNIMPRFSIDSGAYIPNFSFVSFLKHSSCGFFESRKIFNDGKNWIEKNRMRYQTDVQHLIEQWVIEK